MGSSACGPHKGHSLLPVVVWSPAHPSAFHRRRLRGREKCISKCGAQKRRRYRPWMRYHSRQCCRTISMPKGEPTDTTDFVVCTEPIVANCWYKAWGKRGSSRHCSGLSMTNRVSHWTRALCILTSSRGLGGKISGTSTEERTPPGSRLTDLERPSPPRQAAVLLAYPH